MQKNVDRCRAVVGPVGAVAPYACFECAFFWHLVACIPWSIRQPYTGTYFGFRVAGQCAWKGFWLG
jgi:hypothetical protein